MHRRIAFCIACLSLLGSAAAFAGPVTSLPDPVHGQSLAEKLCSNCHLVGAAQEQAQVDVPSFREIANQEGETEGSIMAKIVLPKHPMPTIPLTKSELADLAAYIMTLRDTGLRPNP
ncbi:MAG TPA: c-type cytochrome [Methyloceanibacter sp.]|nr:c-type cytochrome [Methyloceanibacter sp.]